jgi:hypothetical protein
LARLVVPGGPLADAESSTLNSLGKGPILGGGDKRRRESRAAGSEMDGPGLATTHGTHGALPGTTIRIPAGTEGHRRVAILLAAMSAPPQDASSPAFERRVLAICRAYWAEWSIRDPRWRKARCVISEELEPSAQSAQQTLKSVLDSLSRGLGGAEVLTPYFKRALAKTKRIVIPALQHAPSRKIEIERALSREADYRDRLGKRVDQITPRRMPEIDSLSAEENFATRNLKPYRPVAHLIVAFTAVLDAWAKEAIQVAARHAPPVSSWEASPGIWWWDLARMPDYADRIITVAEHLEPVVQHLEIKHAAAHELVRIRLC